MSIPLEAPNAGLDLQWLFDAIGGVVAAAVGFMVRWNWKLEGRIDAVRIEALKVAADGDATLDRAIERLRDDLMGPIRDHRDDFKEWQERQTQRWDDLARWRENMVAMAPTRNHLDDKIDEVVERLDRRIAPLLERHRTQQHPPHA